MTAPLVSVVVPCFRQAHLLPQALASVFAQTHPAVEAVVVNDGSDDDTDEVARGFLPRIRYVPQKNTGLSGARNAGIRAAEGRYLLFLDADDVLHPEAIARLLEGMEDRLDRLVAGGWRTFAASPDEPTGGGTVGPDPLLPRLIHHNIGPVHAFLCSRQLAERTGGFEPTLRACEDWDLWLRMALDGADFAAVPHVGAYYRTTPGSMSGDNLRMLTTRTEVLLRAHAAIAARPPLLAQWGTELAEAALRVLRRFRAQRLPRDSSAALTALLDDLAARGFTPPIRGKQQTLTRAIGRDRAERLLLAYYRWFDRPMFEFYRKGHY